MAVKKSLVPDGVVLKFDAGSFKKAHADFQFVLLRFHEVPFRHYGGYQVSRVVCRLGVLGVFDLFGVERFWWIPTGIVTHRGISFTAPSLPDSPAGGNRSRVLVEWYFWLDIRAELWYTVFVG